MKPIVATADMRGRFLKEKKVLRFLLYFFQENVVATYEKFRTKGHRRQEQRTVLHVARTWSTGLIWSKIIDILEDIHDGLLGIADENAVYAASYTKIKIMNSSRTLKASEAVQDEYSSIFHIQNISWTPYYTKMFKT